MSLSPKWLDSMSPTSMAVKLTVVLRLESTAMIIA